ncbi:MAG TPA: tetratricopeptide repeat protein [Vicingaceae bacterium]
MRFFIFISFLFCFTTIARAQDVHQLDSLNKVIKLNANNNQVLAKTYLELAGILYIENIDTLISLSNKALFYLEKISAKDSTIIDLKGQAYNNIGYGFKAKGEVENAVKNYNNSIRLYQQNGNKAGISSVMNNLGMIYELNGNIPLALENYQKSLDLLKGLNDKYGLATVFNNLGFVHKAQGDYKIAIDYYEKSLKIREEIGDKRGVATSLNNIANVYMSYNQLDSAYYAHKKSLIIREEMNDLNGIANSLCNIGSIFKLRNELDSAAYYYEKSLKIYEEIKNPSGRVKCYLGLSEINRDKKNDGLAVFYAEKSMELANSLGYPELIVKTSALLSSIYSDKGQYKDAFETYKLHITMRDSLKNESTQKATAQQQAKYEYEKQKAIDDAEHEKEILIEQEAKEKQKILTYATGGGLGLVGIFLLIVFNRLKVTRKQKNIIELQKHEVENAHSELEEKNKEITDSITYAKRIQNAILPSNKTVKEYLPNNFVLYLPKDIIAGDFYWLERKGDTILFAAADCTGHGVPGAMVSVVCNNGLNRSVREYGLTEPGKILDKTREIVIQEFEKSDDDVKDGMDITLCSLKFNVSSSKLNEPETVALLQYAGANNPLWIIKKSEIIEIKADKQPIGKYDSSQLYTTHTLELQQGDTIYIFSDGFADQFGGEKGKKFKALNFKNLLLSVQYESMERQKELIHQAFESWKGDLDQLDDICIIGVRV